MTTTLKQHIFLTGFMGSGKTTLGKKLAALFHMDFIDLDAYIEQQEARSISAIFEEGQEGFRKIEQKYLHDVLKLPNPVVVALGGGTVCFENNLALVKEKGLLVYIELPAAVLADRLLAAKQQRPLLKNNSGLELQARIEELLNARLIFYKQAHVTVNGLNLTPKLLQSHIVEAVTK